MHPSGADLDARPINPVQPRLLSTAPGLLPRGFIAKGQPLIPLKSFAQAVPLLARAYEHVPLFKACCHGRIRQSTYCLAAHHLQILAAKARLSLYLIASA
jgi:hypothetical protein